MPPEETAVAARSGHAGEPVPSAEALLQEGILALSREEHRSADALFKQALDLAEAGDDSPGLKATILRHRAHALTGAGKHTDARLAARTAVDHYRRVGDPIGAAKAMIEEANACLQLGEYPDGLAVARESLRVLSPTDEHDDLGMLQIYLGSLLLQQGDWEVAREHIHDALASFRRTDNDWGISRAYGHLAVAHKNLGQLEQSIDCSERAEEVAHRVGRNHPGFALNQGIARYWIGDHAGARACFHRSLDLSHKRGDTLRHVRGLLGLGRLLRDRGELQEADVRLERAEKLAKDKEYRREQVLVHEYRGNVALDRREYEEASRRFHEAQKLAEKVAPGGDLLTTILIQKSELARQLGDAQEALEISNLAVHTARQLKRPHDLGQALVARGRAAHAAGHHGEAQRAFEEGLETLRANGVRFILAQSLCELARILLTDARSGTAQEDGLHHIQEAIGIYRSLGEGTYLARVLIEMAKLELWLGETDRAGELLNTLRNDLRRHDTELPTGVFLQLVKVEEELAERMAERAASANNPFHALQRTGNLPNLLANETKPENELLRIYLETMHADRGFIALRSGASSKEGRVHSAHKLGKSDAESIAQRLWEVTDHRAGGKGTHGISLAPATDERFFGCVLYGDAQAGASLWLRIESEGTESALVYADRREKDTYLPFNQMDLNLAVCLTQMLAVSLANIEMRRALSSPAHQLGFFTSDEKLLGILNQVHRLNGATTRVLLEGETGTGKGHLARVIHEASGRPPDAFVCARCSEINENLVESELFGHKRGAFTSANADHRGLAALADGGTIFIDEIDKASPLFQQRLLGLLDDGEFRPVGGEKRQRMDALVICAANTDLEERVARGEFLGDLYYRLKVIHYRLPPLRERREDILLLVQHFLRHKGAGKERRISPEALDILLSYDWPGNVRSLMNEIERAILLSDAEGIIGPEALSDEVRNSYRKTRNDAPSGGSPSVQGTLNDAVSGLETRMVRDALRCSNWNKSQAARALGLTRRGLDNKIARYRIVREG